MSLGEWTGRGRCRPAGVGVRSYAHPPRTTNTSVLFYYDQCEGWVGRGPEGGGGQWQWGSGEAEEVIVWAGTAPQKRRGTDSIHLLLQCNSFSIIITLIRFRLTGVLTIFPAPLCMEIRLTGALTGAPVISQTSEHSDPVSVR